MLSMLASRDLPPGQGMPTEFSTRFDRLLDAAGDGEGSRCMSSSRASRLAERYRTGLGERRKWFLGSTWSIQDVNQRGMGYFRVADCQAHWSSIRSRMRSYRFFQNYTRGNGRTWRQSAAHSWVVCASVFASEEFSGISFATARVCVRKMTQEGQQQMIGFLGRVGQENARRLGKMRASIR